MGLLAGTKFDRPPRCERCDQLEEECKCPPPEPVRVPPQKQTAKLAVEKRKHGRVVTVVRGLKPEDTDLVALLTQLKNACGAGGAIQEDCLEVQGSHLERIQQLLVKLGYKVKA
jgi:translation initiation factor 1